MDDSRAQALEDGANVKTGGTNFNYVDVAVLERLGIDKYLTKKPQGNNFIRIVAPDTKGAFAREIWKHDNIGSGRATFLCLKEMYGESCPICEYAEELRRQGKAADAKELNPSHRFLLFVIDTTNADTEEEGQKWFDCPVSIYKEVCKLSKDRRTGAKIDPTDPEDGRDVEFVREDGKRTSYSGFKLVATEPIPKNWYEGLPSFDKILLKPNPDEMLVAVSGKKPASEESNTGRGRDDSRRDDSRRDDSRRDRERTTDDRSDDRDSRRDRSDSRRGSGDDEQGSSVRNKLDEIKNRRSQRE